MATIRQFEHYLSGRIAFFENAQRTANDSEKDQFDLVLVELNHMYTEIIPQLEVEDGKLRDRDKGR
jgi:hypothetical protein